MNVFLGRQQAYVISERRENALKRLENVIHLTVYKTRLWKDVKYNLHRFLAVGTGNLLILMLGSLVFFYIEHCRDEKPAKSLNLGEESFIMICNDPNLMKAYNKTDSTNNETSSFLKDIVDLCLSNKKLVLDERECKLSVLEWYRWMEYTFSVSFTLGYGRMVTRSHFGKMLTIFYAIPTIILSTITYVYCGNMVKYAVKIFIINFEMKVLKQKDVHRLNLKTVLLQLLLCTTLILIFSLFFHLADSMHLSYIDAFYFVMVTLFTIGFGDIVINLEKLVQHPEMFLLGNVIFIFGLGTLASLIASLCDLRNKDVPIAEFIKKTTKKIAPRVDLKHTILKNKHILSALPRINHNGTTNCVDHRADEPTDEHEMDDTETVSTEENVQDNETNTIEK